MIRSAGSLWTRKFNAVSQEMCLSRERVVNLIAWVGVRTTIDRLCTGEGKCEEDGDVIKGVSSRTSNTPVTTPTKIRPKGIIEKGDTFLDLSSLKEITL